MSTYRDELVAARFAALAAEPLQGDWLDVQRRARRLRRRRRTLVIAVAAALTVILIGSAVAGRRVIDFFSADPAPHRVVVQFEQQRRQYHADWGEDTPGITGEPREVLATTWRDGMTFAIAVAPTRDGEGFCTFSFDPTVDFGPTAPKGALLGTSCLDAGLRRSGEIIGQTALRWAGKDEHGENLGYTELSGIVTAPRAERLVLRYEDGKEDAVPLTWVSKPIDAGFFAFDPAPQHFGKGHRASLLVALDGSGREVGRIAYPYDPAPADPDWAWRGSGGGGRRGLGWPRAIDRSTAHLVAFPGIPAFIHPRLALGRAGGRCFDFDGAGIGGGCVKPRETPRCCEAHGAGARGHTGWLTVLSGLVKDDWTVEFRYEDDRIDVVRPREQLIVYAVPPEQYARGHWLASVVVRNAAGRVVQRRDWDRRQAYFNFHRRPLHWVNTP